MNKIEHAIYDTRLHITNLEREYLIIKSKLDAYRDQLLVLENIADDKSIPYHDLFDKVPEHELVGKKIKK
jgi:hypothetical protein